MQSLVSRSGWIVGWRQRRQSCAVAPTGECLACTAATSAAICAFADGAMPKSSKPGLGCFLEVSRRADVRPHRRTGSGRCCKFLLRDNGSASGESSTRPTRKRRRSRHLHVSGRQSSAWSRGEEVSRRRCGCLRYVGSRRRQHASFALVSARSTAGRRPLARLTPRTRDPICAAIRTPRRYWNIGEVRKRSQTADAHVEIDGTTAGSRDLVQESSPSALGCPLRRPAVTCWIEVSVAIACMLTVALGCTGDRDHTVLRGTATVFSVLSLARVCPRRDWTRETAEPSVALRPSGSRDSGVRGLRPG